MTGLMAQLQNVSGDHLKEILLVLFALTTLATPFIVAFYMSTRNKGESPMPRSECERQHTKLDDRLMRIENQMSQLNKRIDELDAAIRDMPSKMFQMLKNSQ